MIIRPFTERDLPGVFSIDVRSLAGRGWLEGDYLRLSRQTGGLILVAAEPSEDLVTGFAALRRTLDEAELLNFAIDPEHRRQGIGRALLGESVRQMREAGANLLFLEVRPSNLPAQRLYFSSGFILHSVRKGYYSLPAEDAFVLMLRLDGFIPGQVYP
ncbi:MAG: ribosomal protein S18-alanine N-acetyltransferase [Acidobacteriota bacterium]|nr:ribosomal protein S18-alanine N-acetyltransferase [Acidobacteriota bacterium]